MSLIHLCLYSESLLTFESQEAVELDSLSPFVAGKNEKTCITNSYFILATGKLGPYFCTISCKPQQQKDPRTTYWAMTLSKISKRIGPREVIQIQIPIQNPAFSTTSGNALLNIT